MNELQNVKSYDTFIGDLLTEDLRYGDQKICNKAFMKLGTITFADGGQVTPKEIIGVVEEAIDYLYKQYHKTFAFADRTMNIIYLAHSATYKTMAVDPHMNMYVNAGFVYNVLKMDYKLVAAVIMHEVLHVLYDHIERGKNWLSAKGKPRNAANW